MLAPVVRPDDLTRGINSECKSIETAGNIQCVETTVPKLESVNRSAAVVVEPGDNAVVADARRLRYGESAGKIYGREIPVFQQEAMRHPSGVVVVADYLSSVVDARGNGGHGAGKIYCCEIPIFQ